MIGSVIIFKKLYLQNVFGAHENEMPAEEILLFEEVSKSPVFLTYLGIYDRPNRRKKAAFSDSFGVIVLSGPET